jgi:hypothetical protein
MRARADPGLARPFPTQHPVAVAPRTLLLIAVSIVVLLVPGASGVLGGSPSPASDQAGYAPRFSRIVVIVIENQSFDDIFEHNPGAHYILDELTPASALATRFYAPERNSPTAYYAMSSGHTYQDGDGGDWAGHCAPSMSCSTDDESVYEQLIAAGRSWRIYSEDQAEPCQTTLVDKYWVGHNPAVFYRNLGPNSYVATGDGSCLKYAVSLEAMKTDFANGTLPEYAMIVPNNCNNMHDECHPLRDRVRQGDAWLKQALGDDLLVPGGLLAWSQANDTLLVVTYDEARLPTDREGCCPYEPTGGGGHIPTWVIGPSDKVAAGSTSGVQLSNFSILRTVEENWDLPLLGRAADESVVGLDSLLLPTATRQPVPPPGGLPAVGAVGAAAGDANASALAPVVAADTSGQTNGDDRPSDVAGIVGEVAQALASNTIWVLLIVVPVVVLLLVMRRQSDDEDAERDDEAEVS